MSTVQKDNTEETNRETIIPVQLPKELKEELYWLAVRTGLDKWNSKKE